MHVTVLARNGVHVLSSSVSIIVVSPTYIHPELTKSNFRKNLCVAIVDLFFLWCPSNGTVGRFIFAGFPSPFDEVVRFFCRIFSPTLGTYLAQLGPRAGRDGDENKLGADQKNCAKLVFIPPLTAPGPNWAKLVPPGPTLQRTVAQWRFFGMPFGLVLIHVPPKRGLRHFGLLKGLGLGLG